MSISSASHAPPAKKAASPLSTLLSPQPKAAAKKADNDADDGPAAKPAAPKLATSGPGQVVDKKV